MDYFSLKILHILGSVFLFGTGIGLTFYLHVARRSGDADIIRLMTKNAILADFIFTVPGYAVVCATGYLLFQRMQLALGTQWLLVVAALFLFFSVLWFTSLYKVWRLKPLVHNIEIGSPLAAGVALTIRHRCRSNILAFTALFLIFVLMTFKPWYGVCVLGCG